MRRRHLFRQQVCIDDASVRRGWFPRMASGVMTRQPTMLPRQQLRERFRRAAPLGEHSTERMLLHTTAT